MVKEYILLLCLNLQDGIGDAIHFFNIWKFCIQNKRFDSREIIPYGILVNENKTQHEYILNKFKPLNTKFLKIIPSNEKQVIEESFPTKSVMEKINSVIVISNTNILEILTSQLFPWIFSLIQYQKIFIMEEINGTSSCIPSMNYQLKLLGIPEDNLGCMGFPKTLNRKKQGISMGLPLNLTKVSMDKKINIIKNLNKEFHKLFYEIYPDFNTERKSSIVNFLENNVIIQFYPQIENSPLKNCRYLRSYLDVIIKSPVLKGKNIIFLVPSKIKLVEKYDTISEEGGIDDGHFSNLKSKFPKTYQGVGSSTLLSLEQKDQLNISNLPENVWIYKTWLDDEEYESVLQISDFFKICSGDNTIIETINYYKFPLIMNRHNKFIYWEIANMWKDEFPRFYDWASEFYKYSTIEEYTDYSLGIIDDCEEFDRVIKDNLQVRKNARRLQRNIEKYSSYFDEEFFREWYGIIEKINKNFNLFKILEKKILTQHKIKFGKSPSYSS